MAISLHPYPLENPRFDDGRAFPIRSRVNSNILQQSEELAPRSAFDGFAQAYSEAAFNYFLDIERKRSERSNRRFMLLLADFGPWPGTDPRM